MLLWVQREVLALQVRRFIELVIAVYSYSVSLSDTWIAEGAIISLVLKQESDRFSTRINVAFPLLGIVSTGTTGFRSGQGGGVSRAFARSYRRIRQAILHRVQHGQKCINKCTIHGIGTADLAHSRKTFLRSFTHGSTSHGRITSRRKKDCKQHTK
jgi:hypothetical protein